MNEEQTFPIVLTQRRVLPLAILFAVAGAAVGTELWMKIVCGVLALAGAGIGWWQHRARPSVIVGADAKPRFARTPY